MTVRSEGILCQSGRLFRVQGKDFGKWERHLQNIILEFMAHGEHNVLLCCLPVSGHI